MSLVLLAGGANRHSDGDTDDPRFAPLQAFLAPFITPSDASPLDADLGYYLTPTESRFLVRELVCTRRYRAFDGAKAAEGLFRLVRMNAKECKAYMKELQEEISSPWLTVPLEEFGSRWKCSHGGGKPPRAFLSALFAALLTS